MQTEKRDFYKNALKIALPIMAQSAITNFVSMLDNIMVGRVGTDSMNGVAIVNQLIFVWALALFGALAGVSIFTAQYYGKKDEEGMRYTFRMKLYAALLLIVVGGIVAMTIGTPLISLYLHEDGGVGNAANTLYFAQEYLRIMMIGLVPFAIGQAYTFVIKATGETVAPMKASFVAVAVNLIGNYILIFGKFGAPALGSSGAAIATVLSRFVEALLIIGYTHRNASRYPFVHGLYKRFHVPWSLAKQCLVKGMPLLISETLWSGGQAALARNYAVRGLSVVAAVNISNVFANVFNVVFISMGTASGIILGHALGAGRLETAKRDAWRLVRLSFVLSAAAGLLMCAFAGIFPKLYNTSEDIRHLATGIIIVVGLAMPLHSISNSAYFTIRAGGKTWLTFFFDCATVWGLSVPLSYVLATYTHIPVVQMFIALQVVEVLKCVLGLYLVHRGSWVRDLTKLT